MVHGDWIAWVNRNDDNPAFYDDVFLYDRSRSPEVRLTRQIARQWWPSLSMYYVGWEDHRNGNADIFIAPLPDPMGK